MQTLISRTATVDAAQGRATITLEIATLIVDMLV